MQRLQIRWPEDYSKDLRTLPKPALARLMLAVFLTVGSSMLSLDLTNGLRFPLWWSIAQAAVLGGASAAAVATSRRRRWVVVIVLIALSGFLIGIGAVPAKLPVNHLLSGPSLQPVRLRLARDAALIMGTAVVGYAIFVRTIGRGVAGHVRTRAELVLAEQVQQSLAPPLAMRVAGYEVHGRSAPSSQMGGDLLDAVDESGSAAVYLADVAGHGIQAGVFMGMVKSSARMALLRGGPIAELLRDLNRVVYEVKTSPSTYVAFSCLRCGAGGRVEYAVAGSGPMLHYQARSRSARQLGMEQFPLGMFPKAEFESGVAELEPGDVLAVMTDGIPETADANDEQFGLERIGEILAAGHGKGLAELTGAVFAAVRGHGAQTDDETLVLIRASV